MASKIPGQVTGFPSAAADYIETGINLNDLVQHKSATFFFKMENDALRKAGVLPGALMIVDCSLKPGSGALILAVLDGTFLFCFLVETEDGHMLTQTDNGMAPVKVDEQTDFRVYGVVTYIINTAISFGDVRFGRL